MCRGRCGCAPALPLQVHRYYGTRAVLSFGGNDKDASQNLGPSWLSCNVAGGCLGLSVMCSMRLRKSEVLP